MTVEKFMFNRSFDKGQPDPEVEEVEEEVVEEEVEPEVVVPTFSEEELEAAKKEAFEKGREEALKESATAMENQIVETTKDVSQKLDQLIGEQKAANRDIFRDSVNVAYAVTKKVFPSLNDQQKLTEIETLLQKTLVQVLEEPRVTIEVHPDMEGPLNERISEISAETHYEGKLLINAVSSISDGDCKIEWSNGGAVRNLDALIAEADTIIENNLATLDGDYVPSPDAYTDQVEDFPPQQQADSGESAPTAPSPVPDMASATDETVNGSASDEPSASVPPEPNTTPHTAPDENEDTSERIAADAQNSAENVEESPPDSATPDSEVSSDAATTPAPT